MKFRIVILKTAYIHNLIDQFKHIFGLSPDISFDGRKGASGVFCRNSSCEIQENGQRCFELMCDVGIKPGFELIHCFHSFQFHLVQFHRMFQFQLPPVAPDIQMNAGQNKCCIDKKGNTCCVPRCSDVQVQESRFGPVSVLRGCLYFYRVIAVSNTGNIYCPFSTSFYPFAAKGWNSVAIPDGPLRVFRERHKRYRNIVAAVWNINPVFIGLV